MKIFRWARKEGYFTHNAGDGSGYGFVNWTQGFTPITQSESLHSTLSAQCRRHGKDAGMRDEDVRTPRAKALALASMSFYWNLQSRISVARMLSTYKVIELGNGGDGKWLKMSESSIGLLHSGTMVSVFATLCDNQQRNELQSLPLGFQKESTFSMLLRKGQEDPHQERLRY